MGQNAYRIQKSQWVKHQSINMFDSQAIFMIYYQRRDYNLTCPTSTPAEKGPLALEEKLSRAF